MLQLVRVKRELSYTHKSVFKTVKGKGDVDTVLRLESGRAVATMQGKGCVSTENSPSCL